MRHDEKEINKVVNPTLAKPAPEKVVKPVEVADLDDDEDYYDDFYEEDDDEDEEMAETADGESMNVEESSQGSTTSDHLQHKSQSS